MDEVSLSVAPSSFPQPSCVAITLGYLPPALFELPNLGQLSSEVFLLRSPNKFAVVEGKDDELTGQIVTAGIEGPLAL